jgi:hypothetical protein
MQEKNDIRTLCEKMGLEYEDNVYKEGEKGMWVFFIKITDPQLYDAVAGEAIIYKDIIRSVFEITDEHKQSLLIRAASNLIMGGLSYFAMIWAYRYRKGKINPEEFSHFEYVKEEEEEEEEEENEMKKKKEETKVLPLIPKMLPYEEPKS